MQAVQGAPLGVTPANSMSAFQLPPLDHVWAVFIFPRSSIIWPHVTPSVQKAEAPEEFLEECCVEEYTSGNNYCCSLIVYVLFLPL